MTELIEQVAIGLLGRELNAKCPYTDPSVDGVDEVEGEDVSTDDAAAAKHKQSNDGGVLGKNLIAGSPGKKGTVGGPCPPPEVGQIPRIDSRRARVYLRVAGTDRIADGTYGFTVAAHHLIPGEASLEKSELIKFMTKGKTVEIEVSGKGKSTPKQKKVAKHIGYNVNGAHNGVWLPGNYYIRTRTSPIRGKSWSALGTNPWCLNYVAAATKAAAAQFHDTHEKYSEKVLELLNKIALRLGKHECDECKDSDEISPPFHIKNRLYGISKNLRGKVSGAPSGWDRNWMTSDRWSEAAFSGTKPSAKFNEAYLAAGKVTRRR